LDVWPQGQPEHLAVRPESSHRRRRSGHATGGPISSRNGALGRSTFNPTAAIACAWSQAIESGRAGMRQVVAKLVRTTFRDLLPEDKAGFFGAHCGGTQDRASGASCRRMPRSPCICADGPQLSHMGPLSGNNGEPSPTDIVLMPIYPPNGMVLIAGGTFPMGSDVHSLEGRPAHYVTVDAFWID
jgi:hypothetical protein